MTDLTPQQEEDARDALSDLRRVIGHLEDGESTLEEVARVWCDNKEHLDPILQLVRPRREPRRQERKDHREVA